MIKFFYALLLTCSLLFLSAQAAFSENPDYSELSTKELELKARTGDAHAYYTLGYNLMFDTNTGEIKTENLDESLKLIRKADLLDHDEAPSFIALYYFGEFGGDTNSEKAQKALLRGIERGGQSSKLNFGIRFIDSDNIKEAILARKLLTEISEDTGVAEIATPELMRVYTFGNTATDPDLEKGRYFAKLCSEYEQEYAQCNFLYARYLQNGWGGDKDVKNSTKYFKRAAEADDARAQWNYGMALIQGIGTDVNLEKAYHWVRKSADNDYMDGLISFAVMNAIGQGTEINNDLAYSSYEKAAKLGSAHALRGMSLMIMEGQGTVRNRKLGLAALIVAYENGEENAGQLLSYLSQNPPNLDVFVTETSKTIAPEITKIKETYPTEPVK